MLLSVLTAATVGTLSFVLIDRYVDRKAYEELRITAETIEGQIRPYFGADDARMQAATEALGLINNLRIRVLDPSQRPLIDTDLGGVSVTVGDAEIGQYREFIGRYRQILENQRSGAPRQRVPLQPPPYTPSPEGRIYTIPVQDADDVLGYIEFENRPGLAEEAIAQSRSYLLIAGLAAVAAAVIVGLGMGRRLTGPLLKLGATVKSMEEGDLSIRANIRRKDEIGELAQRVNRMADTIEGNIEALESERDALKAFAQDASHELRTPVTALRTFNELLQRSVEGDADKRKEFLEDSAHQIERLQLIVDALLTLTRFDADLVELNTTRVNLSTLLESIKRSYAILCDEKSLTVDFSSVSGSCEIECDAENMTTALANVFENAAKYSRRGGTIAVSCLDQGNNAIVKIEDNGPGIPEEECEMIFKRFYRARQTQAVEGSGLGLAIAQSIVTAHGGTIAAESSRGRGAVFTIILPHSTEDTAG